MRARTAPAAAVAWLLAEARADGVTPSRSSRSAAACSASPARSRRCASAVARMRRREPPRGGPGWRPVRRRGAGADRARRVSPTRRTGWRSWPWTSTPTCSRSASRGASWWRSRERSRGGLAAGEVAVLAPSRWMRAADPLPHTWDVTSDSVAAYVAVALDARRLVLVKPAEVGADGVDRGLRADRAGGSRRQRRGVGTIRGDVVRRRSPSGLARSTGADLPRHATRPEARPTYRR